MKLNADKLAVVFFIVFCLGCAKLNFISSKFRHFTSPRKVSMEKADISDSKREMADLFASSDKKLHKLIREIKTFEKNASERAAESFYSNFEFTDRVALMNLDADIEKKYPGDAKLQKELSKLLEGVHKSDYPRKIHYRLAHKNSDIFIFKPVYKEYSLYGYLVVGVNIHSLVRENRSASQFLVLTPQRVLWPGKYKELVPKMLDQDWNRRLKNAVTGEIYLNKQSYIWFARYIGFDPIVYLMKKT